MPNLDQSMPRDDSSKEDLPTPFPLIFINYQKSIAAVREFFAVLNPVVATLDTGVVERRDERVRAILGSFREKADPGEKESMRQIGELLVATLEGATAIPAPDSPLVRRTFVEMFQTILKMTPSQSHHELLNCSILTTLVGYFEVLLSDLVHNFYRMVPEATANDDKVLSVNELRTFGTVEEAFQFVISKRVDDLLRGGLDEFQEFFKKRLKIDLTELVPDWYQWQEMFQRRHLIVHSGRKVDRRYIAKVDWQHVTWPDSRPGIGQQLPVNDEYLSRAIDLYEIAGLLLCQSVWKKLAPSETEDRHSFIGGGLIRAAYDCLLSSSWFVAEHLSAWGAADNAAGEEDRLIHSLNNWLSVKRQGRGEEIAEALASFDASAKHPRFLLGLASLRENPDEFFRHLPAAVASGVSAENLREWPILEEVRADPRFDAELQKLEASEIGGAE